MELPVPVLPLPRPLATTSLLPVSKELPFWTLRGSDVTHRVLILLVSRFWVRPRGGGCQPPPLTTTEQCRVAGRSPPCWSLRRRRAGGPCPRGGTVLPCTLVPEVSRGAFSFPVALCVPRSGLAGSDGDAGSRRSGLCQGPSPQQPARLACALVNAQVIEARAAASVAGTPHVCVHPPGGGHGGLQSGDHQASVPQAVRYSPRRGARWQC